MKTILGLLFTVGIGIVMVPVIFWLTAIILYTVYTNFLAIIIAIPG